MDLGLVNGYIELEQVKLEKVSINLAVNSPKEAGISVFPNPVHDFLFFVSENPVKRVEILDITGRVLLQESFSALQGDFNMTDFFPGYYFAFIYLENGQNVLQKIIVL
jgi:hypothetical protein